MAGRTGVASWYLFDDLGGAQGDLLQVNRLRPQPFNQPYHFGLSSAAWEPAVDISERKDAYLVAVELPGVEIGDIGITFEHGVLTIQGQRRVAHDSSEERVHRAELRYGAFRRSISLPPQVNPDTIEASTQGGVLQIVLPKSEEVSARRIQISLPSTNHKRRLI